MFLHIIGHCRRLVRFQRLLQTFSLNGPKFTDSVTERQKELTSLKELYLVKTQIGDNGLAYLKGLTNLERLYPSCTQVTDDELEHLKDLTGLRRLDLKFTQITDAGENELSKALPNCRIYR